MSLFKVSDIIDGSTIAVTGWSWGDYAGKKVKIAGFNITDADHNAFAKGKLQTLLIAKSVELKDPVKAEKSEIPGNDIIYCSVYLNDVDIAQYFPELKISA